ARAWTRRHSSGWAHGSREVIGTERVQHLAFSHPAPARDVDAVTEVAELTGRVRVHRDHEAEAAFACRTDPARLHVEPMRVAVHFDRGPGARGRVEHLLHPAVERGTPPDEAALRVPPDLE